MQLQFDCKKNHLEVVSPLRLITHMSIGIFHVVIGMLLIGRKVILQKELHTMVWQIISVLLLG